MTAVDSFFRNFLPGRRHFFPSHRICQFRYINCPKRNIHNVQRTYNTGTYQKVINRLPPFIIRNPFQTVANPHDSCHIPHIAVRIPAAHIANIQCIGKITFPIKQRQYHHRNVGNDMTIARIFIITIILENEPEAIPPVIRVFLIKSHHCPYCFRIFAVFWNIR